MKKKRHINYRKISIIICILAPISLVISLGLPNSNYWIICLIVWISSGLTSYHFFRVERVEKFVAKTAVKDIWLLKRKKVKPYLKWILYEDESDINGTVIIKIIIQVLFAVSNVISSIFVVGYIVERNTNNNTNEEFWETIFIIQCLVILVVNLFVFLFVRAIYWYCAAKGDKYAKEYLFSSTSFFQIFKKSREEQQAAKKIQRLAILQNELKKYQCSKYKGEYCIDSTDIEEIEDLISKQYPEVYVEYNKKNGKSVLTIYRKSTQAVLFSSTVVKK